MKSVKGNIELVSEKIKEAAPAPPAPPLPRLWVRKTVTVSVTNKEIAKFWRQKRIEEEEHLLAAIKAAARVRAQNLSEEDYKLFVDSLGDEEKDFLKEANPGTTKGRNKDANGEEFRIGIKDWWTKSKYAYLNQPEIESSNAPKLLASTYVPNCFNFKTSTPLYPTSLGVF